MHYKTIILSTLLSTSLLFTAGCGLFDSKPKSAFKNDTADVAMDKARRIANSARPEDGFTVNPVAVKDQVTNTPKPEMTKSGNLFSTPAQNSEERIARVESHVQRLSDTLNRMAPKITKLMDVESELNTLTFQLEDLIEKGKMDKFEYVAPPPPPAPEKMAKMDDAGKKDKAKTPPTTSKNSNQSDTLIHAMRVGDHPGKTRVVFETMEKVDYKASIDETEDILVINFPDADLKSNIANKLKIIAGRTPAIKSIIPNRNDDGLSLIFDLSKSGSTLKDFRIAPNKTNKDHRIVLDLMS